MKKWMGALVVLIGLCAAPFAVPIPQAHADLQTLPQIAEDSWSRTCGVWAKYYGDGDDSGTANAVAEAIGQWYGIPRERALYVEYYQLSRHCPTYVGALERATGLFGGQGA